jgi:hypothetical protein
MAPHLPLSLIDRVLPSLASWAMHLSEGIRGGSMAFIIIARGSMAFIVDARGSIAFIVAARGSIAFIVVARGSMAFLCRRGSSMEEEAALIE